MIATREIQRYFRHLYYDRGRTEEHETQGSYISPQKTTMDWDCGCRRQLSWVNLMHTASIRSTVPGLRTRTV